MNYKFGEIGKFAKFVKPRQPYGNELYCTSLSFVATVIPGSWVNGNSLLACILVSLPTENLKYLLVLNYFTLRLTCNLVL